jgi:hypothetical protein
MPMTSREFDVSSFARQRASAYASDIGQSPRLASRKLRGFLQRMLDAMDDGEVQEFPMPSVNQKKRHKMVLQKVHGSKFRIELR